MQTNALIPLEDNAPPPLGPLTDVVISPANIEAQARRQRATKLTFTQRRAYRREIKALSNRLKQSEYGQLVETFRYMRGQLELLYEVYHEAKGRADLEPDNTAWAGEVEEIRAQITPLYEDYQDIREELGQYRSVVARKRELTQALEDHKISLERERYERQLVKAMEKEALIYQELLIDKWTRLGFCHEWKKGDKRRVDKVGFSEIGITLDAIFYKIDASYQTLFKHWKTNLPRGVMVATQLLSPDTLTELSIACQRQVTGIHSSNGAWVIVHRLDSVDGLMNYVSFPNVMERFQYQEVRKMPICVGVGMNRQVKWVNLSDFPHWLVGGFTNSGKSNMVNVGICTLLMTQSPRDLRLVLIDLKGGLEFQFYEKVPHVHRFVDTVEGVADALAELEAVMHWRFTKIRGMNVKKLEEYQAKSSSDDMPRILCVFDEVASIQDHGEVTRRILSSLRELTRMGRAVGIHVWLCTQRPDVKAIEGPIKANLAVRLSGRMTTSADSVTVLGSALATELAPVQGRMVLSLGPDPEPIQTPHIRDEDITEALNHAMQYEAPPPLELGEFTPVVHQQWTVERVVELSLKHLGGNITWKAVYQAADDLSQSQARALVEKVWKMDCILFEGREYRVERGKGWARNLVEIH